MAVKKACRNCRREKAIVAGGLCFVCRKASLGITGEAKAKALEAIKAKIDRGEIKQWNAGPRSKIAARSRIAVPGVFQSPSETPPPTPPEKIEAMSEETNRDIKNLYDYEELKVTEARLDAVAELCPGERLAPVVVMRGTIWKYFLFGIKVFQLTKTERI